ncbi:hypothetical protein VTN02DRAFT_4465 [Thermoascus thermophilus]
MHGLHDELVPKEQRNRELWNMLILDDEALNLELPGPPSREAACGYRDRTPPLHNWQWLFVIVDFSTAVFSVIAWFWLPADPGTAWFLSPTQRNFAVMMMPLDTIGVP